MFKYTEKKFAKDVGKVAKSIDPSLEYTYLPEMREVKLTSPDDDSVGPFTVFLGNIFLKVSELPKKERLPTIEAFLREVITPTELSPDELLESLALRVRTDFEIDFRNRHIELMGHEAPPSISMRRGELLVEVVSDRDESVSIARSDDLAEIGVSEDEAVRLATAKIRRITGDDQWEKIDGSIWISRYQDDYDFARLVAAEDFGQFPFKGKPIVFVPSHSICLATDSTDTDVLLKMTETGNESAVNHRPFCQLLWTLGEDCNWMEWRPGEASESWGVAQLQAMRETISKYEEMKDYLERSLVEDVFVATFQAMQDDDGLTCYSVYTLDLPSYLPRTDFVAIVDPGLPEDQTVIGRVDWNEFEKNLGFGAIEQVEDLNPPWYRIMQKLDAAQKERLCQMVRPLN
ncbi:MAG: hypothetical protein GY768_24755 [Planctomycetaceae bacterium]|nr:hypothetical protein [Planctomycetaceae bacterium]